MVQAAELTGPLLTVQEAAVRLKVSRMTMRKLLETGKIAFINVGADSKQYRRVAVAELERFLRERFTGRA